MVADRIDCYRLEGLLGTGGMGEVYRGWDERLDRPVAIKLIRADQALGKAERQRLLREARALAKLSHPAIVQIYYFLEWEGRGCFIMELVEGRTLAELLRQGRLELAGALRLGHEIAGALAAAHAKGIVHRDLKTQNVMVTPDGHAKVLDFGLARLLAGGEIPVTTEGIVVGTPHVMAPEQVQGEGVDHRADLFSFGALLYEMLTARTPFRGATQQETLARVVMYSQPPARMLNPAIPAELSECIDRLLEKDPARRPQSAVEVVAVLDGLIGGLPTAPTEVRLDPDQSTVILTKGDETIAPPDDIRPNPRAMLWIMAVVALLAVGTYFGYRLWTPAPEPVETPNPVAVQQPGVVLRPSAAVLSFHSRTGRTDADWLATALAELLRSYVAAGDEIRIVRGNRVATVERDLAPGALATLTPEERSLLRRNLGVDRLIGGTFEIMGDGTDPLLRIALQVEDPATGQVRPLDPKTGVVHPLPQLIRLAGEPLRPELGAAALTSAQWLAVEASFPSEQEAARLYAQALARLRRDDSLAARDLLGKAVAAEPDHPLLHAALAEAWLDLGYYDDAAEAAQKAFTLVGELPPPQRLTVEALRHEANGDEDRAIAVYRSVFEASPDDFDAGLRLAEVQIDLQRADEVLATLDELEKLPAAAGNPRLALARAQAWEISGDHKRTRTSAERAAQQAELRGASLLAAEAHHINAAALMDLGEIDAATAAVDEAIRGFREGGDLLGLAASLEHKAGIVMR
ncbi:MAG: protein kinase, partial [bacterium]|nr:protein kinase [bacterium]